MDTVTVAPTSHPEARDGLSRTARRWLAVARVSLGWIFAWTFADKLWGLGYSTSPGGAWLDGASPTSGYLAGADGAFANLFVAMNGQSWVDWLYMAGMGGLGLALTLGIGLRLAACGAVALLGMLWLSSLPLQNNPFMDQHLIYLIAIIVLAATRAGDTWGLGRWWSRTAVVRALPLLK